MEAVIRIGSGRSKRETDSRSLAALAAFLSWHCAGFAAILSSMPPKTLHPTPPGSAARIILIRHGQPAIALRPRADHREFGSYIDAYEAAGLDPQSLPPREIADLVKELSFVFTSGFPRAHESARALAPHAVLTADSLFAEAPLASPPIPLLRMRVQKWAVVARLLWHAGYHPGIENYAGARARAGEAADILTGKVKDGGAVALVAHGYFNAMIGRQLRRRGFHRTGSHRVHYWNAVIYDWKKAKGS
jgi:broad specificity phosphatase PhoE